MLAPLTPTSVDELRSRQNQTLTGLLGWRVVGQDRACFPTCTLHPRFELSTGHAVGAGRCRQPRDRGSGMAGHLRRMRRVALLVVAVLAATTISVGQTQRAEALVPNDAAFLAINVPSSLLASGAPSAEAGALLANAQTFSWEFLAPEFATVSGTATSTPVATTTLTAAEQEAFESLARRFFAPSTGASLLAKAGMAMGGYMVGASIGHGIVELRGWLWEDEFQNPDNLICSASTGVAQVVVGLLSGSNCEGWNTMNEEFHANTDVTGVTGMSVCDPSAPTRCIQIAGYGANSISGNPSVCFAITGVAQKQAVFSGYRNVTSSNGTWTTNGSAQAHPPGTLGSSHACRTMNQTSWILQLWGGSVTDQHVVNWYGFSSSATGSNVSTVQTVGSDPSRVVRCSILGTDNVTYSADSGTFTEGSGQLPGVVCPELPFGVATVSITLTEVGGAVNRVLWSRSVTGAYNSWLSAYPECANGSCLLDLRKQGDSCFLGSTDCDGWWFDPNKSALYTCVYGTHILVLSECAVYANAFSETHRDSGNAYADPATGDSVQTPTSPTEEERLTQELLDREWLEHGPTASGLTLGAMDVWTGANLVARQCIALSMEDECKESIPIFAPGDDVREAAQHDLDAIVGNPAWAALTYAASNRPAPDNWKYAYPPCDGSYAPLQCDEYPFLSSQQGGPGASLRLIDAYDNSREGSLLSLFYGLCGLSEGDPFLVIPIPTSLPAEVTSTSAWCEDS